MGAQIGKHVYNSDARKTTKAAKAADAENNAGFQVGDILYSSWGYEQTNIDYYEVVRVSGVSAWIRPIAKECEYLGPMHGTCTPVPGKYTGDAEIHRTNPTYRCVRLNSYSSAYKWGGRAEHFSEWY